MLGLKYKDNHYSEPVSH